MDIISIKQMSTRKSKMSNTTCSWATSPQVSSGQSRRSICRIHLQVHCAIEITSVHHTVVPMRVTCMNRQAYEQAKEQLGSGLSKFLYEDSMIPNRKLTDLFR
jgi:hypothetical protein